MNDTLEKPVVDQESLVDFSFDEEEQCSHSLHGDGTNLHDDGPATHWMDTTCGFCGDTIRGYRCARWVSRITATPWFGSFCSVCSKSGHMDHKFTPIRKTP